LKKSDAEEMKPRATESLPPTNAPQKGQASPPNAAEADAAVGTADGAAANDRPLTSEELAALRAQADKANQHWDLLLRTTAEFDNFKKRAARERQEAIRYANETLLQKLIPVLDTFDMALGAAANATESSASSLQTGVNMILSQLRNTLIEAGLEEIDATGKTFDPNIHEAVSQRESAEVPEGQVVQQLRRGYKLRDRLLRPASVVVSKKPEPAAP
jgi:molecular chaperone GrpE